MNRLEGNRILVTGAAPGSGQATALRLLDEGSAVVAADISTDGLAQTQARADAAGTGEWLTTREMDIGDENSVIDGVRSAIATSASVAHPYMAAYAASKGGTQSFTHSLALEYAGAGLRAVSVAPGSIKSGITDATAGYLPPDTDWSLLAKLSPILPTTTKLESTGSPMADPGVVAGVIAMLVSDDGAFITGPEIRIDGGTHA